MSFTAGPMPKRCLDSWSFSAILQCDLPQGWQETFNAHNITGHAAASMGQFRKLTLPSERGTIARRQHSADLQVPDVHLPVLSRQFGDESRRSHVMTSDDSEGPLVAPEN